MERADTRTTVGPIGPSGIPTPRSQIAVLDKTLPAGAAASNTSQLAIAARAVVAYWRNHDDPGNGTFFQLIDKLDLALQQQA